MSWHFAKGQEVNHIESRWRLYFLRCREYSTLVSDVNPVVGAHPDTRPIFVHNAAIIFGFSHEFRSYATPVRSVCRMSRISVLGMERLALQPHQCSTTWEKLR
jgi:hypothetical protein